MKHPFAFALVADRVPPIAPPLMQVKSGLDLRPDLGKIAIPVTIIAASYSGMPQVQFAAA